MSDETFDRVLDVNTRGSFAAPMWTPILNNIVVILTAGAFILVDSTQPTPETITQWRLQQFCWEELARLWLDRSVAAGVNPARLRLAVHLLSTDGDQPGSPGYDDAVSLLDDAFADGYNTARKFSQTTTDFDLPMPGEQKD